MDISSEPSKISSPLGGRTLPLTPSSLRDRTIDLLVQGFINANEDWNSRRLRYNLKKYGKIRAEKLEEPCIDSLVSDAQQDLFRGSALRRQVSLMTHLGTPVPFSSSGVTAYRNSALRTLSNLFLDTAVRRRHGRDRNMTVLVPHRRFACDSTILKLPAGTVVSSPLSNEASLDDTRHRSLYASSKRARCLRGFGDEDTKFKPLHSAPPKDTEQSVDNKSHSCIELRNYTYKAPITRPLDLPVKGRRIFFPSSSTSQLSKTPDLTDCFVDMAVDFEVEEVHASSDVSAHNASHVEATASKLTASRLTMLRPPPLDLASTSNFTKLRTIPHELSPEVRDLAAKNQNLHPLKQPPPTDGPSDFGTPYIIRPRVNRYDIPSTPLSPLTPLILLRPDCQKKENSSSLTKRSGPFRFLSRLFRKSEQVDEIYRQVDDSMLDYRPYFTYMLCFIHLLVMVLACIGYGFAPIGINLERTVSKLLMVPSLDIENVCRVQDENIWIGPQQADLIRMGARFSPCMRVDDTLKRVVVEAQRNWDRRSGCCINMKDATCHQTSRLFCSRSTSTWLKNSKSATFLVSEALSDPKKESFFSSDFTGSRPTIRSSLGPVCGLDPDFCAEPRSTGPFTWSSTDVTEWPICTRPINSSSLAGFAPHMECDVVARPCCVGLKGECIITTPAHCTFLQGRFHSDARLCSQVRCLQEVCGMTPFIFPNTPDQISRILISLFLHAGVLHLALSLFIQLTVMRYLEKLLGCVRIAAIFILSGCFSGLASGIMLPYHVHTGPTGAHFALFAVSLMDSLQTIDIFVSPWSVILKQAIFVILGFFVGFLPWLDNYAHISGFVSGVLLAYVFVPYLGYGSKNQLTMMRVSTLSNKTTANDSDYEIYQSKLQELLYRMRLRKLKVIIACLVTWLLLFFLLILIFIKWPLTNCTWCKYFNCLPWTPTLCDTLEVNVHAPTRCINPRT